MGRGDKKSKKGKITLGSYGNSRKRNAIKAKLKRAASKKEEAAPSTSEAPAKPRRTVKKKAEG